MAGAGDEVGVAAELPGSVPDTAVCTGDELGADDPTGTVVEEREAVEVEVFVVFDCRRCKRIKAL